MQQLDINLSDLVTNPARRVPVVLCLDTSYSMAGQPIQELNSALAQFCDSVKADAVARHGVELAIVTFSSSADTVQPFQGIATVQPPLLTCSGCTSLGAGIKRSLDLLEARKAEYKATGVPSYQPWIVIITDGQPTDDTHLPQAQRIARMVADKRLTVFAIGVGGEADMDALKQLSPKRPPVKLVGLNFSGLFEFLNSSVVAVSRSRPQDAVQLDTSKMSAWGEV